MKTVKITFLFLLILNIGRAQILLTEGFETPISPGFFQGDCSCIDIFDQFSDGSNDYYGRQNNGTISANSGLGYTGYQGSHYFAGEHHDSFECTFPCTADLCFIMENISVPNPSQNRNYRLSFFAGANPINGAYDMNEEFLTVSYSIDNQNTFTPLFCFSVVNLGINVLSLDEFCSGTGDGTVVLDENMKQFSKDFQVQNPMNNQIHIEVCAGSNSSNEEWAVDNFVLQDVGAVLPVELSDFSGKSTHAGVELMWETQTESNNSGFEIQRSTDSEAWESLAWQEGRGYAENLTTYGYLDTKPKETNYYRLKQVDLDGSYSYSEVIRINLKPNEELTIFPNPTTGMVYIAGLDSNIETVKVYNQQGREVLTGKDVRNFSIEHLPLGVYRLELVTEDKVYAQKLLKI